MMDQVCQRCEQARATALHHRKTRARGGNDHPYNLVALCGDCHLWVHMNPAESTEAGLLISASAPDPVSPWV